MKNFLLLAQLLITFESIAQMKTLRLPPYQGSVRDQTEQLLMQSTWILDKVRPVDSDYSLPYKATTLRFINKPNGIIEEKDDNNMVNSVKFNWSILDIQQDEFAVQFNVSDRQISSQLSRKQPISLITSLPRTSTIIIRKLDSNNENQLRFTLSSEGYPKSYYYFKKQSQ